MARYQIGIDLAKHKTGWCVIEFGQVVTGYGVENELWDNDITKMVDKCKKFINDKLLSYPIGNPESEIMVGIEIGNFGNANMTCDFNLLAGILISCFYNSFPKAELEMKVFPPISWQKFAGIEIGKDTREICKKKSMEHITELDLSDGTEDFVNQLADDEIGSTADFQEFDYEIDDDEADAINIAYYLEKIKGKYGKSKKQKKQK